MSLDVYLRLDGAHSPGGSGIFIREAGSTREVTREEWDRAFPGREPVLVAPSEGEGEVYEANITHNLNRMAEEAGLYDACWRPYRVADPERAKLADAQADAGRYHEEPDGAYAIERSIAPIFAGVLIEPLRKGLALLESDRDRFEKLNPENGWGDYDGLVSFVRRYLRACEQYPQATVGVSR